jgi:hypothetical protein
VLVNRYRRRESLRGRFMVALDREGRCGLRTTLVVEPGLGLSAPLSRVQCSILTARLVIILVTALVGGAARQCTACPAWSGRALLALGAGRRPRPRPAPGYRPPVVGPLHGAGAWVWA